MQRAVDLREILDLRGRGLDIEGRLLKKVAVLRGPLTQGGRRYYSENAMRDIAKLLGERVPSFLDHAISPRERKERAEIPQMRDLLGYFLAGYFQNTAAGPTVYGDLELMPNMVERMASVIKAGIPRVGFSVDALGSVEIDAEGREIVATVRQLRSVDLVSRASSTVGIFESLPVEKIPEEWEGRYLRELAAGGAWRKA